MTNNYFDYVYTYILELAYRDVFLLERRLHVYIKYINNDNIVFFADCSRGTTVISYIIVCI